MWGRARGVVLLALALALLVPAAAQGSVTIGSNLGRAPEGAPSSYGCAPSCTLSQATLAADRQAAGGLVSPVNGKVVLWRIRAAGASTPTALRVIRSLGGGLWTGAGRSTTVTPATNAQSSFPTQLPIAIGDSIGIDCCQPSAQYFLLSGGTENTWNPALAEGGAGTMASPVGGPHEIAINADIEPNAAFVIGAVKSGKGGKVTVTATLPNPGVLEGGDKRDTGLAAAAAGKKKTKYLKRASAPVGVAGQTIRLLLKPTNAARAVLDAKGKLKTKAKMVFTPTGGSPSIQVIKVKLKN
jgi:hypothetical protein